MSILHLPYELVTYVIQHLDLGDISSLSRSCRRFQFLVQEASIAKWLLKSKAPFSTEAVDAQASKAYAAGLRRLIKRREAIASVSPYLVALVGFAEGWLYENGVLCYSRGLELRVLDLHSSANEEIVIDLQKLLCGDAEGHRYKLKLLYYSHSIVSCIFTRTPRGRVACQHWLLALDVREGRIITFSALNSISKLFVRNDDRFLYYGTTTEPDEDGDEHWVIRGFDITARKWLERSLTIPYVIGTDIGSTVCFEIFDAYFYGLSNQRTLYVEEVDWLSYYSCFRFPLTATGFEHVEEPPDRQLWRRDHTEGPIDDRWTFLRMTKHEVTGQLLAVESRQEWLAGSITARRTYYTTPISFDKAHKVDETAPDIIPEAKTHQDEIPRRRPRDPHLVHPGDDSSTMSVTLTRCPLRSYHPACQTHIDLVNDSSSFDPRDQRLRIRGGTRSLWAPAELAQRKSSPVAAAAATETATAAIADGEQDHDTLLQQIDALYKSETGIFWPPEPNPSDADADPALADLYEVLNPPGYAGNHQSSWDERSMVYATGGSAAGGLQALVFVSWDPSICLTGTAAYPGGPPLGRLANSSCQRRAGDKGRGADKATRKERGRSPMRQADGQTCEGEGGPGVPSSSGDDGAGSVAWKTVEPAMYREIARGYHFAS